MILHRRKLKRENTGCPGCPHGFKEKITSFHRDIAVGHEDVAVDHRDTEVDRRDMVVDRRGTVGGHPDMAGAGVEREEEVVRTEVHTTTTTSMKDVVATVHLPARALPTTHTTDLRRGRDRDLGHRHRPRNSLLRLKTTTTTSRRNRSRLHLGPRHHFPTTRPNRKNHRKMLQSQDSRLRVDQTCETCSRCAVSEASPLRKTRRVTTRRCLSSWAET